MQFKSGASVYTSDGTKVGSLKSVVMTPRDQQINGLVVERGLLFTEDKVLPLNWVAHTEDNGDIILYEGKRDFDNLPLFEETYYVNADDLQHEYDDNQTYQDAMQPSGTPRGNIPVPPAYYYFGAPGYFPVNAMVGVDDTLHGDTNTTRETVQNIPDDTVALRIGSAVYSNEEDRIGTVEQIFTSAEGDQTTHVLIAKGFLMQQRKLVPTAWVESVTEDGVYLSVNKGVVDRLPDYDTHNWESSAQNSL